MSGAIAADGYRRAFRAFARGLRKEVDEGAIAAAWRGGPNAVIRALGWPDRGDEHAHDAWAALWRGFEAAGVATMRGGARAALREVLTRKARDVPDLSVQVDERALRWARERAGARIRDVSASQVKSVRTIVEGMMAKGARPDEIAEAVRRVVGLTELQAQRVERRRASAMELGAGEERAAEVADKYADELRDRRADAIARTETKESNEEGRLLGWRDAIAQDLMPSQTRRTWVAFGEVGKRLCEICNELDGQTVGLDEPFWSEILQEHVDRPPSHPNCRCTQVLDFGQEAA